MTRSYMLELARTVQLRPKKVTELQHDLYVCYSKFLNNPIYCVFNESDQCVAVYYRCVFYAVRPVKQYQAIELKELYKIHKCTVKVFLYPNTLHYMYKDEFGSVKYDRDYNPDKTDYSDLIPLRISNKARV